MNSCFDHGFILSSIIKIFNMINNYFRILQLSTKASIILMYTFIWTNDA